MDKFFHKYFFYVALVIFVASVFLFTTNVMAKDGHPDSISEGHNSLGRSESSVSTTPESTHNDELSSSPTKHEEKSFDMNEGTASESTHENSHIPAFAKNHLKGSKLQACQSVQGALTTRSSHLTNSVLQMEKTFTSIAQGVEQYYLTKVVPTGKTLSNYDELVANIATAQNALTPLVAAAQSDVNNFSCTGNNPGAQMTQFRTDMQAVIQGLKDYRTSIKNLIVAVRTLPSISATESITPSPTTTPSSTIEPSPTETPIPTATLTPVPTI